MGTMDTHDIGDREPDRRATVRTERDVIGFVTRTCFKTGPPGRVGIESEWFIHPVRPHQRSTTRPVPPEPGLPDLDHLQRLADQADPLPGGSRLTFEPGGQLELSTACGDHLPHALSLLHSDLAQIDKLLSDDGLRRVGVGVDHERPPLRQLRTPRYDAMEQFFDTRGPEGRLMMTSTAAVQVCLDAGVDDEDVRRRWSLTHALAPVLVAAFANSPLCEGRVTGWASTRQHIWSQLDLGRVRPALAEQGHPAEHWARYALDARVMAVRSADGPWETDPGMTLREWVSGVTGRPGPTYDDVAYHLSTLFPPVRPHGWLELRMIDALPDHLWPVAVAVTTALVDDAAAADRARDAIEGTEHLHEAAARDALRDVVLRRAATRAFEAALDALPRLQLHEALIRQVDDYADRYVAAGRTPGDDLCDDWRSARQERSA
jgi:glutamate--cysteine ligase